MSGGNALRNGFRQLQMNFYTNWKNAYARQVFDLIGQQD
jgi:hypothetical protein